jgi:hypothetical protein
MNGNAQVGKLGSKHIGIHHSIKDLGSITKELNNLLTRIQGQAPAAPQASVQPMSDTVKPARPEPTLSDFLSNAGGEIDCVTDHARSLIGKLNEALF